MQRMMRWLALVAVAALALALPPPPFEAPSPAEPGWVAESPDDDVQESALSGSPRTVEPAASDVRRPRHVTRPAYLPRPPARRTTGGGVPPSLLSRPPPSR